MVINRTTVFDTFTSSYIYNLVVYHIIDASFHILYCIWAMPLAMTINN